jgi:hypothetical protein
MGFNLNPISAIVGAVGQVIDDLHTSDEERAKADLELRKVEAALQQGQIDVNKEEAKSASLFVAGWRPAVGWIGAFGLGYAAILEPIGRFVAQVVFGYSGAFPAVDTTITMQVLFGILGLGADRTAEKFKGVAR